MNWQCRLYGHQWRHPGEYEVLLVDEGVPAYPFECPVCETTMLLDAEGNQRQGLDRPAVDEPELAADDFGTDLDTDFGTNLDTDLDADLNTNLNTDDP